MFSKAENLLIKPMHDSSIRVSKKGAGFLDFFKLARAQWRQNSL
jgi:hypothetical protein